MTYDLLKKTLRKIKMVSLLANLFAWAAISNPEIQEFFESQMSEKVAEDNKKYSGTPWYNRPKTSFELHMNVRGAKKIWYSFKPKQSVRNIVTKNGKLPWRYFDEFYRSSR